MIQTVIKRDGRVVGFNEEKIVTAIRKAMLHTDKGEDLQLIRQITDHISFKGSAQMTVEAIQDAVEMELMKSSRKDVAQKYIAYRNQRSIARKAKTRDMFLEIIEIKSNDVTRENANMNADTPAGMMMKFASETTKPFVDDYLLSDEVLEAVHNNYLHIHDKDYYPTKSLTCVQHPLDRILSCGFSAGHGESRPAKRIETASILGCISLETAQNEMHGGQAIPAFDFLSGTLCTQQLHRRNQESGRTERKGLFTSLSEGTYRLPATAVGWPVRRKTHCTTCHQQNCSTCTPVHGSIHS